MDQRQARTRKRAISAAMLSSARKALPDSRMACASYMPALAVACAVHDLSRCEASGGCCSADSTSVYSAAACLAILQKPSTPCQHRLEFLEQRPCDIINMQPALPPGEDHASIFCSGAACQ